MFGYELAILNRQRLCLCLLFPMPVIFHTHFWSKASSFLISLNPPNLIKRVDHQGLLGHVDFTELNCLSKCQDNEEECVISQVKFWIRIFLCVWLQGG